MQRGVAKGLKVHCLFMITEVSIRCQKNPEVGIRRIPAYTPQYTTADNHAHTQFFTGRMLFLPPNQQRQSTEGIEHCQ